MNAPNAFTSRQLFFNRLSTDFVRFIVISEDLIADPVGKPVCQDRLKSDYRSLPTTISLEIAIQDVGLFRLIPRHGIAILDHRNARFAGKCQ